MYNRCTTGICSYYSERSASAQSSKTHNLKSPAISSAACTTDYVIFVQAHQGRSTLAACKYHAQCDHRIKLIAQGRNGQKIQLIIDVIPTLSLMRI
jgi:hypothetical protein